MITESSRKIWKYILQLSLVATKQNLLSYGLPAALATEVSCSSSLQADVQLPEPIGDDSESLKLAVTPMEHAVQAAQGPRYHCTNLFLFLRPSSSG